MKTNFIARFMGMVAIMAAVVCMPACGGSLKEVTVSGFTEKVDDIYVDRERITPIPDVVKLVAYDGSRESVVLASTAYKQSGFTQTLPQDVDVANLRKSTLSKTGNLVITIIAVDNIVYANDRKLGNSFHPSMSNYTDAKGRDISVRFCYVVYDIAETDTKDGTTYKVDVAKGWNYLYTIEDVSTGRYIVTHTTKNPSPEMPRWTMN